MGAGGFGLCLYGLSLMTKPKGTGSISAAAILLEDGFYLLQEDGSRILTET